jgi:hypothetical protein
MGRKGNGIVAPSETRRAVAALIRELGIERASRELSIGREQVVRIAGGFGVRIGTLAIARERLCQYEQARNRPNREPRGAA